MELLHVFLTSVGSVVFLFILTKLLGNKQMSQLSMFDYINGITIGSIAAEMATSLEDDFLKPMIGMAVYTVAALLISMTASHSVKLRKFFIGRPLVLYDDGKLYRDCLKKAKLDLNEFLTECRNNGYFNLSEIQTAIMETNGKISILPTAASRPVTPSDMNLTPAQEKLPVNLIIDGVVLYENLQAIGKDEKWLEKQLRVQGYHDPKEIFLAVCDDQDNVSLYVKVIQS